MISTRDYLSICLVTLAFWTSDRIFSYKSHNLTLFKRDYLTRKIISF
jgi:hypothetical protein